MNITKIQENIKELINNIDRDRFIYDLLRIYGLPKASITRLQKGSLNLSKNKKEEILWKKKLCFKVIGAQDPHETIDTLKTDQKIVSPSPRFIIVTNFKVFLSIDIKTQDTLDIDIVDLDKHHDFFLPWAGIEKAKYQDENPADVKAAEKMARLFDEIKKSNSEDSPEFIHSLNVFFSRLLFCLFAEDTNIFQINQFTNSLSAHTQADGNDTHLHLERIFAVLNSEKRDNLPEYLDAFPYVNGGLFKDSHVIPMFTRKARKILIECGQLNWAAINPDIFGSMMQAVVSSEDRGGLGMHYTSVSNIMKVVKPLFLDELYEDLAKAKGSDKRANQLLSRIHGLKIFDPACGSGNFLIIAYKELRKLEMKIFKEFGMLALSEIKLSQFYGIEIDDFAHEIAKLSLWLAEHQMNIEFFREFGRRKPSLPLKDAGNIVCGNACCLNWGEVCPKSNNAEIYVIGNPPYLGARLLSDKQKDDMRFVFNNLVPQYNNLDYIACWFFKGKKYIQNINSKFAFVSTNSICQGVQVGLLWCFLIDEQTDIFFAYQAFKWTNNAKGSAGVTCVIVGMKNTSNEQKYIYNGKFKKAVFNVSPYIVEGKDVFVLGRSKPLAGLPNMSFGSMPNDGGNLLLTEQEYLIGIKSHPCAKKYIRPMLAGKFFLNGNKSYCIWIDDEDLIFARKIEFIKQHIDKVKEYRESSKREATRKLASVAHRFGEIRHLDAELILVPATTSERRIYIPIGFFPKGTIVNNTAQVIFNAEPWIFGIISSRMHMVWVRAVAGRLESRIRYSNEVCYNTFPLIVLFEEKKKEISECVFEVLREREKYPEKTIAQLYDPNKMPNSLRKAHHKLDLTVEQFYSSRPFESDEERLTCLFELYEEMIRKEKEKEDAGSS